jgi:hypothetical protein
MTEFCHIEQLVKLFNPPRDDDDSDSDCNDNCEISAECETERETERKKIKIHMQKLKLTERKMTHPICMTLKTYCLLILNSLLIGKKLLNGI